MVLRPCVDFGGGGGGGGGYVDCYAQQNGGGLGGGHHFYESIKASQHLDSFRLRDDDNGGGGGGSDFPAVADQTLCNDDTSSIASKKRIDRMFKTTASVAGDENRTADRGQSQGGVNGGGRRTRSLVDDGNFDYGYATPANGRRGDKNTVQQKIEKMFAEISSSELDTDVSIESTAAAAAATSSSAVSTSGGHKFHVQYIGCAGLSGKISSLEGLQRPVRDMYFEYRENQHQARDFSGLLEISAVGLTIRYRDERGDTVHRTDAFPSIAVWAALKYVCRAQQSSTSSSSSSTSYEYAFLPLIADPDGSDKAALFRDLDAGDRARLDAAGDHAPVFAVITRCNKPGGGRSRALECHGFACETENDALLMAANLYGALVTAMSSEQAATQEARDDVESTAEQRQQQQRQQRQSPPSTRRYIRHRNGFTSMSSTAGSSVAGDDVAVPPALPPPRPPRRNKKSTGASSTAGDDTAADMDDVQCSDAKTFRMTVGQPPSLRRGLCNSSSTTTPAVTDGDILTKVAIPRSRSFLHSNGLASGRYARRATGCGLESAAANDRHRRRSNGSSVMGFSDMFNELRAQEGLNNMDEILNAIINVEGMSYNDLKPIYREFLNKLSMTLTKDELYQRTKVIMTEQKRKRNNNNKRGPAVSKQSSSATGITTGRGRRLGEKLRNALDLRAARSRIGAVLLPDFCRRDGRRRRRERKKKPRPRRCACSAVTQQAATGGRKSQRRTNRRAVASAALKSRRLFVPSSSVCSTSDESEFFAAAVQALRRRHSVLKHQQQQQQQQQPYHRKSKKRGGKSTAAASEAGCLHRTSSGYFSCSECSAAGGAAAAAVDDKCYCGGDREAEPTSLVSCSCDSDSCVDSDKCYCGRPRRPRNIFDELKSRGFAPSESSVSRADSPGTAWKKNELMMLLHQQQQQQQQQRHDASGGGGGCSSSSPTATFGGKCGVEPSKSIEYLQVARRRRPTQGTPVVDRMKVYGGGVSSLDSSTTAAAGSSSSPASSLSAATVYSSSSAVGGGLAHQRRQRRSGSSGSDNFRAIDYALFATNGGGRKSRDFNGRQQQQQQLHTHYRPSRCCSPAAAAATSAMMASKRSYSTEAVHLTGCRVYHHQQQQPAHQPVMQTKKAAATRRHSVHNGGGLDELSSFFKSDIENSLGYYP